MYIVTIIAMHKQLNSNICITCYYICTNQLQSKFAVLSSPAFLYATDPVCRQLYGWQANLQQLHVATWNMHANTEHATQLHGIDVLVSVTVRNENAYMPRYMHCIYNILYNFEHYECNNILRMKLTANAHPEAQLHSHTRASMQRSINTAAAFLFLAVRWQRKTLFFYADQLHGKV